MDKTEKKGFIMTKVLKKLHMTTQTYENVQRILLTGIFCIAGQMAFVGIGMSLTN